MKQREWEKWVAHIHFVGFLRYHTSNGAVSSKRTWPAITHQPWTQSPTSLLFPDTVSNRGPWWKLTEDFLQCCLLSWVNGVAEELKGKCLCLVYIQTDCSEFFSSLLHDLGGTGLLQYSSQYSEPVYNWTWNALFHTLVNLRWSHDHRTRCAKRRQS